MTVTTLNFSCNGFVVRNRKLSTNIFKEDKEICQVHWSKTYKLNFLTMRSNRK